MSNSNQKSANLNILSDTCPSDKFTAANNWMSMCVSQPNKQTVADCIKNGLQSARG